MQPYPPPPPQGLPPARRRSAGRTLWLGVLVALIGDLIAIVLLPSGLGIGRSDASTPLLPGRPASPSTSVLPTSPADSADAGATPSLNPGGGQVAVTPAVKRGLAMIRVTMPNQSGAGTGMVLTADGQVLTNYHVVRSTSLIRVTVASTGKRYDATLIGRDATRDVALLQLEDASGLDTVRPDDDPIRVGDPAVAAGNAGGQGYITAFSGSIVATNQSIRVSGQTEYDPEEDLTGLIETDAHAEPGDSGGAMYDAELEVLGMTTAGSKSGQASAYAVPIGDALAVAEKIRRNDESGTVVIGPKPYLGIVAERADAGDGVPVSSVEPGSAAARAGVSAGDMIMGLSGRRVRSHAELSATLDGLEPNQTVEIAWVTADGQERTADITLGTSSLN